VNHIAAYPEGDTRDLFHGRYGGDWRRVCRTSAANLRSWGFNTAGYDSPSEIRDSMPFMVDVYLAKISYWMAATEYPDVFDPAYRESVERSIRRMCAPVRSHPNLIGYYWTDTPRWDLAMARRLLGTDWVSRTRSLPASAPGKRRYVAFLREVHEARPDRLRAAYGLDLDEADALLARDFADLDLSHPTVASDDRQFLRLIAREYYRIVGAATRREDPEHLVFGDRYLADDHPVEVIEEALPWIDVLSVQPVRMEFEAEMLDRLRAIANKPVLICDHQSSFYTDAYPRTLWEQSASESDAARAYDAYLSRAFESPYVIGYHRCQYIDRFAPSLNVLKQGLLREDETPYPILVDQVRRTNLRIITEIEAELGRR
jgi:hypothetical protein